MRYNRPAPASAADPNYVLAAYMASGARPSRWLPQLKPGTPCIAERRMLPACRRIFRWPFPAKEDRGRAIATRLPESVAAAVLDFCDSTLAENPHRVGKPLTGPLSGCHGARRGTYRIAYRIDENSRAVHVLDIDHRLEIYRPHQ